MAVRSRFAVLQARQSDVPNDVITTQALSWAMLSDPQSVATFWNETTFGHVDLTGSEILPDTSFALKGVVTPTTEAIIGACIKALRDGAEEDPLKDFDGVLIAVNPGTFTYANPNFDPSLPQDSNNMPTIVRPFRAACKNIPDDTRPAIIVPTNSVTFTMLYHEMGHALGFGHPIGLRSSADDNLQTAIVEISDEYGSPYDVMGVPNQSDPSSPAWWSYDSTHPGTRIPDWSGPSLATQVGPNLSRAHLHFKWPEALDGRVVERPLPYGGNDVTAVLTPGRVLVMRLDSDATDPGWRTYVEYRDAQGWDAGLAPSRDSAGEGVIVHHLTNTVSGLRVRYAGAVRRHTPDADVAVYDTGMTVTVTEWGPGVAHVNVSVHANWQRIEVLPIQEIGSIGPPVSIPEIRTTPCGSEYEVGTWESDHRAVYAARTFGFGESGEFSGPASSMRWTIDGQALLPTGTSFVTVSGAGDAARRRVDYTVYGLEARLEVYCGFGVRVDVEVAAAVDGFPGVRGVARLLADGQYSGIKPSDVEVELQCILDSVPINLEWLEVPTSPPRPLEFNEFDVQLERHRTAWVRSRLQIMDQVTGLTRDNRAQIRDFILDQLPA